MAAWAYPYGIDPRAVMKLLRAGRIFLILEGFDEMALVGDSETRLSHFRTLWKFCYPLAKILITGRPNFFLDDMEMRAALGISKSIAAGPYCVALHLEPFSLQQMRSALRAVSPTAREEIVELARKDDKFREIVSRGSLLYVVSQLWDREQLSTYKGQITSAFVMDLFIQHTYRRQALKTAASPNFMILNEGERKYFMNGIAAFMGALGLPNQITRDQFERSVNALYTLIPNSATDDGGGFPKTKEKPLRERLRDAESPVEDVCNDVRASGILVVDQTKSGALRFAHKSFMEYLMARVYGDNIMRSNREISSALIASTHLTARNLLEYPESLAFLGEIFVGALSAPGKEVSSDSRHMSTRLFDLLVVKPMGDGLMARWLARVALTDLAARSVSRFERIHRRRSFFSSIFATKLRRPDFWLLLAVTFFVEADLILKTHGANPASRHYFLTTGGLTALLSLVVLTALSSLSLWSQMNSGVRSAVRVWFICCLAVGLSEADLSEIVKARWIRPIAEYLGAEHWLPPSS